MLFIRAAITVMLLLQSTWQSRAQMLPALLAAVNYQSYGVIAVIHKAVTKLLGWLELHG